MLTLCLAAHLVTCLLDGSQNCPISSKASEWACIPQLGIFHQNDRDLAKFTAEQPVGCGVCCALAVPACGHDHIDPIRSAGEVAISFRKIQTSARMRVVVPNRDRIVSAKTSLGLVLCVRIGEECLGASNIRQRIEVLHSSVAFATYKPDGFPRRLSTGVINHLPPKAAWDFHCCPVRSPIDSTGCRGRVSRCRSRRPEVPVKWAFSRRA